MVKSSLFARINAIVKSPIAGDVIFEVVVVNRILDLRHGINVAKF